MSKIKNLKGKFKGKFNYLILILITFVVLYFSLKDDFDNIVNQLLKVNLFWVGVAFVLLFGYWFFRSLAINTFTRFFKPKARFANSFLLMLRTQFFNAVTPFATGGQPYQVYYLKQEGIPLASSTSIILQNFIVYQIALVFLGGISIISNYYFHFFKEIVILQKLVTLGFIINTVIIVIMFIVAFDKKMNKRIIKLGINILTKLKIVKDKEKKLAEWDESISNFHSSASILLKDKWSFIKTILENIIALTSLYLIPLVLLYSMGDYSSYNGLVAVITSAYVILIGSFVPIPGGSGGLEYGFIAFYGNFIAGPMLTAIMLLWRFVTYYFGMIMGAIALNVKRVK